MAITIVLAATPLGYIPAGVLSFTIMVLPVAIGGVLMGTPAGLILGLTFGVTSFIKAPTEALGQLILSYSGLFTAFVCIVPRVCVGLFAGLMHNVMKGRQKQPAWLYLLAGGGSSFVNTALFVGMIYLFCHGRPSDVFHTCASVAQLDRAFGSDNCDTFSLQCQKACKHAVLSCAQFRESSSLTTV